MTNYFEFLENLINLHLKFLENAEHSSQKILRMANEGLIQELTEETENRERIFSIVTQVNNKIDSSLKTLKVDEINNNYRELMHEWKNKFDTLVENINKIDQEILNALSEKKNQTTQEIATVHTSKEKFKGYNLNNLKP